MKTFFNGFNTQEATFTAVSEVLPARAVAYTETGDVYYPQKNAPFTGIVTACRDNVVSVAISGYAVGSYNNSVPSVGICKLTTGENGYLEVDEDKGTAYTVLSVDSTNKTFEFIL